MCKEGKRREGLLSRTGCGHKELRHDPILADGPSRKGAAGPQGSNSAALSQREVLIDLAGGCRPIERVEVQAGSPASQQGVTQLTGDLDADRADRCGVVLDRVQALRQGSRECGASQGGNGQRRRRRPPQCRRSQRRRRRLSPAYAQALIAQGRIGGRP